MKPLTRRSPKWHDLTLRPTRLGAILAVMTALLWIVGMNYQVNLAYFIAFALLGFLLMGVLANIQQLTGLQLDVRANDEMFVGQKARVLLLPKPSKRERHLWFAEYHEDTAPQYHDAIFPANSPDTSHTWHIQTTQRGTLKLPPLICATVFPFGICSVYCIWHWPEQGVVYPAPLPHTPPVGRSVGDDGDQPAPAQHSGADLSHLQEHQAGASLQHIAWKSYAKTGRLLDKQFEEPAARTTPHIIHYQDYPAQTPPDRLAGLLCYRVLQAEQQGDIYTLVLPQQTILPQNGQREKCLYALAFL